MAIFLFIVFLHVKFTVPVVYCSFVGLIKNLLQNQINKRNGGRETVCFMCCLFIFSEVCPMYTIKHLWKVCILTKAITLCIPVLVAGSFTCMCCVLCACTNMWLGHTSHKWKKKVRHFTWHFVNIKAKKTSVHTT